MTTRDETAEEQDRVLSELAQLGLDFARELKARIAAVNTVAEAEGLALAFHRVARSVRLAIALRSKLARDRHDLIKLDRALAVRRTDRRKDQIRAALSPEIFTDEADEETAEALTERLDERLDDDALFDAFLDGPLDAAIAKIREDLGLAARPEPDPPPEGEVDRATRRETEGVAAHSPVRALQPPQSASLTAPPRGEHLWAADFRPAPS